MKILIRGVSCSGKSTLARKLSGELKIQRVEIDEIRWKRGWQCLAEETIAAELKPYLSEDNWIVDGNNRLLQQYIDFDYDFLIWLDFPFHLVVWRCLLRSFKRILSRETVCNGNRETFPRLFRKDSSMIYWVFKTFNSRREELRQLRKTEPNLIVIRSKREEKNCIAQLQEQLNKLGN
jgi:adenylate kinase family enzyme